MDYQLNTRLNGNIAMTSRFHENKPLQRDKTLDKFLWVQSGTLSFLVTTPEVWVPDLGSGEHGFPLLTGAGRLVIKDTAILAGAIVVLADSAKRVL